jgi:glycosyltransferase involved in cell wall biosynthesis
MKSEGASVNMYSSYSSIRIRPELRAAQVARAQRMTPALTLYFDEKYDLGETVIPSSFRKVRLLECLWILARSEADVLEIPEPLWLRFAVKNLLLSGAWKFFGFMLRRQRISVTYAIENNELRNLITPTGGCHPLVERATRAAAGLFVRLIVDRFVFGSAASKALYHSLDGVSKIPFRLIEELPARTAHSAPLAPRAKSRPRAIFIGELDDRKGILDLMDAWPSVERAVPKALLTVVGGGKHAAAVSKWCGEKPDSRSYAGFVQHDETARLISDSDVLVAPSRRAGRWREQIGLPIVEGLSAGLTIVTTDETGLATWLSDSGHVVIPEGAVRRDLPIAITQAIKTPLTRDAVLAALPETPGRVASDSWLHTLRLPTSSEDRKS